MASNTTQPLPPVGTIVSAKRLGWNEVLTVEQEFDLDPYDDHGEGDDLRGEIDWWDVPASDMYRAMRVCLVGGQDADPDTVRAVDR